MSSKIRQQIERRKREVARRLDKNINRGCDRPSMTASNIHYEIADRTRATAAGGIGALHMVVSKLGLAEAINRHLGLLKLYFPYHDSDHVLNIAYNLLAGGRCLEHLELLRTNVAYLDALGACRIPDPTTAGDFCRRFDEVAILACSDLQRIRCKVWRQQPKAFFERSHPGCRRHDGGDHWGVQRGHGDQLQRPVGYTRHFPGNTVNAVRGQSQRQPAQPRGAAEYFDRSSKSAARRASKDPPAGRHRLHADRTFGRLGRRGREVHFGIDATKQL